MSAIPVAVETSAVSAADIVQALQHLPSAPKVLPRLTQLLNDANSSINEIVALVRLDPGIAARVLQVANSVYYGKGLRVCSVDEAVLRLGYDQVYQMVSYASASQILIRPLAVYGIEADELWKQAVACALAAETLATLIGEDRNIAYTVGLLHGVGMVAINEWAIQHPPVLMFMHKGLPFEYVESERALTGLSQAEVGAALLEHWDFPVSMCSPVRWQYAPLGSPGHIRMAALLQVAKWIRSVVCSPDETFAIPESYVIQPLRLGTAQLKRVVGEVRLRLIAVRHLLEIAE